MNQGRKQQRRVVGGSTSSTSRIITTSDITNSIKNGSCDPTLSQPEETHHMNIVTVMNMIIPLLGIVLAFVWFHIHHQSPSNNDDIRVEWNINPHPTSNLHIGKDRCTIERMKESDMTYTKFITEYWRMKPIILLRDRNTNTIVQQYSSKSNMIQQFATQSINVAGIEAYAFREERFRSFSDYIHQLSNSTSTASSAIDNEKPTTSSSSSSSSTAARNMNFNFGIDKYGISDRYVLPNVLTVNNNDNHDGRNRIEQSWHYQIAIAGYGIGLPFHWHGDVFAEVLHGVRRWFLYPPNISPQFNPRTTSQQWFQDIYLNLYTNNETHLDNHLLECTMYPNEVLYVPADWFHATLSLGEAVAITTSLAQQYRAERHTIVHSGSADHAFMIDAVEQHNFSGALHHVKQLVTKYRTNSFVPYSWLSAIYTLQLQTLSSEAKILSSLEQGKIASEQCIQINPYFAPCFVWYSRQLMALSHIHKSSDPQLAQEYQQMYHDAKTKAALLSHENDDELLDPRWQPKKKRK